MMANIWGKSGNSDRLYFLGLWNHCGCWPWSWNWKILALEEKLKNLDSILQSRDITLLTVVCIVKGMVFPIVMYGCESWTICKESWAPKKWCFWTVVLEKTLEGLPWTARRSNQSILKEISPEYSLEGLMLKLKLQYFGHLMWRI